MSVTIADAAQREMARDPGRSVIVQAPAGSGKTELLMQRYLALLACADEPEQILAVTFTRKAAAEMRSRIIGALQPTEPDERLPETAALASQVLQRDRERGWSLLAYPARLRIRTFDSVNSWISDCAPLSGEAGSGTVTEQTANLYQTAARRALEQLPDEHDYGDALRLVMRRLDNQTERFIGLMAQMLPKRDQWLPLLGSGLADTAARRALEESLALLIERELQVAAALLSSAAAAELQELLAYAAVHAGAADADLAAWREQSGFPDAGAESLSLWRSLAAFCLKNGAAEFRKKVDKRNGFPTQADGGDPAMKARALTLLEELAELPALADALHVVRGLPDAAYSDAQWQALAALIRVLPLVAAELSMVFRERGETDYLQIAADALLALADDNAPTPLALRLDYRIQHILIDEFQDTSRAQYRLLRLLTEGWTGDDGRSLMIVGDPMQSIYRFRQAEVSLYMELWEQGIGNLQLQQLTLSSNFRSRPAIVDWVNNVFAALLPAVSDPATGAVQFAEGTAAREPLADSGVTLHAFAEPARRDEAERIGELVQHAVQSSASDTVGILVRTRHQARLIAPVLRRLGIPFAGAGLEQPGETAVEQDLLALTRALCHPADRTAWLALLRAPWCGLTLADLDSLCRSQPHATLLESLRAAVAEGSAVSPDGARRLAQFMEKLEDILARNGKTSLRDWVEGAWQQLGGPAALSEPRQLRLAQQFFTTLDEYDDGCDIAEAFLLHERLASREDDVDQAARVHLLTIFKAKGLEYDVVILPALDGITRQDDKQAVAWHEFNGPDNNAHYLMAPVEAVGDNSDPLQDLIRRFDRQQAANERDRLLYVATTRAKKQLHLCFEVKRDADAEPAAPRKGSLLERLWPALSQDDIQLSGQSGTPEQRDDWVQPLIHRLVDVPAPPQSLPLPRQFMPVTEQHEVTYEWAGSDAMHIGSVVHRCLQFICERQQPDWFDRAAIKHMLAEAGVVEAARAAAAEQVERALQVTLAHDKGRWLLGARQAGRCEFPVTVCAGGATRRLIIDRTFVDDAGVRWVVDYKTSAHEGGDVEGFIANELERYAEQLAGYCAAMQALEPEREVRAALYFPLLGVFAERN